MSRENRGQTFEICAHNRVGLPGKIRHALWACAGKAGRVEVIVLFDDHIMIKILTRSRGLSTMHKYQRQFATPPHPSSNSMTVVSDDPSWWLWITLWCISSYFVVAASAGVTYDWALTFGQEVH
ncbi:hypothetical protein DFJ58DRAFT_842764 [Suillus subalutaceus]|uniref:uncharacterized protein n=1 Tax=Suillus subalutaceus TaxID=48586 RepID=UPI001B87B8C6|nr:uncharacterized protein DFJ58DRAFT_842764 [Suillus subalutaceus]KAG1848916.1 hypothetical protein DFJ58DRAFT_842764 [Suillus subalutaceus]